MYISIFSDEFFKDVYEVLPIIKEWGMTHVDFRGMINGKPIENQTDEELYELKAALDKYGLKAGVIQSSLCKVHLPDKARQEAEMEKLEGIIRASKILGTNLVRSFSIGSIIRQTPLAVSLQCAPMHLLRFSKCSPLLQKEQKRQVLFSDLKTAVLLPTR